MTHRARRARATIMATAAVLVAAQLAVEVALRLGRPDLLDEELGPRLVGLEACVQRRASPLVVLALGSSRVQCGFAAPRVEGPLERATGRAAVAYNLGVRLGFFGTDEVVLRRVLDAGIRPDLVVAEANALALLDEGVDPALYPERLSGSELARVGVSWERGLDWSLERAFPAHGHRVALQREVLHWGDHEARADGEDRGWRPIPRELLSAEGRAQALLRTQDTLKERASRARSIAAPARDALVAFVQLLERERIRGVLVATPEGPTLRGWYRPEFLRLVDGQLAQVAREHGLAFVSARDWLVDESRFQDSHHLDTEGAEAFTDRLTRELIQGAR